MSESMPSWCVASRKPRPGCAPKVCIELTEHAMSGLRSQRLPIAAMALLVGTGTVAQAYAASRGADISRSAMHLWYVCFSYSVAWWVEIDRKAKGIGAPFEYSAFMFFVWPLLAPYYLFKS